MKALALRDLENMFLPCLRNCVNMAELKRIHANVVKHGLTQSSFLLTKLVMICDRNGEPEYAGLLYKTAAEPNVFLCNAVMKSYARHHLYVPAVAVFKVMLLKARDEAHAGPDEYTLPIVLKACAGLGSAELGREVHGFAWKVGLVSRVVVGNGMIDMYGKFGCMECARKVFDEMSDRDLVSWNAVVSGYLRAGSVATARQLFDEMDRKTVVSWTTMISGYVKTGRYDDAISVFHEMQMAGVQPDEICVVAVLTACAQVGAFEFGKWVRTFADKSGFLEKTFIANAFIEMYSKCGSINEACRVFNQMRSRDVISWSTMIGGLANHGKAREAIELFNEMKRSNVEPNGITFLGLISACSHAGLTDEGLMYIESMTKEYRVEPTIEHYGCIVDILGRAGRFDRALSLIEKMPMQSDSKIWGSLLSSCRSYCNLEVAVTAMQHLIELEPDDTGNYVLLSNIFARLGKWEEVSKLRRFIRSKSMKKTPGCSLVEVDNVVEEFVSGDDSKPFSKEIFWLLELLSSHQGEEDDSNEGLNLCEDDTSLMVS
uniref:Pentatricopeptide repeat-containing protein n=1 Tax=Kalanchoe fedtschenkoi TaxID=63787 RepID=A0A7N0V0B5_KALFE